MASPRAPKGRRHYNYRRSINTTERDLVTDNKFRVEYTYDPSDLELIRAAVKEIWLDHPEVPVPVVDDAFVARRITGPHCLYAVGRISGRTIAFASAKPHGHGRADGSALRVELELIYVDPAWRGKGYGDKVMRGLVRKLRESDVQIVTTSTMDSLQPFFERRQWRFVPHGDTVAWDYKISTGRPIIDWHGSVTANPSEVVGYLLLDNIYTEVGTILQVRTTREPTLEDIVRALLSAHGAPAQGSGLVKVLRNRTD